VLDLKVTVPEDEYRIATIGRAGSSATLVKITGADGLADSHMAIFALEMGSFPAETGYVNRNVDPRFTEPHNTMIYKEINHKKD
jgi:hypothetical protein